MMNRSDKRLKKRRRISRIAFVALIVYVFTYLVMSRIGYRQADAYSIRGFYFVYPSNSVTRGMNHACRIVFYPLTKVEQALGTGRTPASDPIEALSYCTTNNGMQKNAKQSCIDVWRAELRSYF